MVIYPIYFDWSADGRLWVVEMRDYPLGIDGRGKPGGAIRVLEDTDGDGRYDKSSVFMENVNFPTGLMPWRNGILVCAPPDVFYSKDKDGDGKSDQIEKLFTGFGEGNQQHRANGFVYGLDNWVYGANGDSGGNIRSLKKGTTTNLTGRDFRFRPEDGSFETVSGKTQFGRNGDEYSGMLVSETANTIVLANPTGARETLTIDLPTGGSYDVWLNWACHDNDAGNRFRFAVGDQIVASKVPGTGTWDFYKHAKFGHIELPPGRHRAVFQPDAKLTGFLIDLLEVRLVTTDADSPPEFPPLGEVVSKP